MKIVGLCGEPGTGKTTVMRAVRKHFNAKRWFEQKYGTLEYLEHYDSATYVLGKYTGDMFDGTDKLSMAVINDAEGFLKQEDAPHVRVLFEGDRLWCPRFVNFCVNELNAEFLFLRLYIDTPSLVKRHTERAAAGHRQDVKFITSRHTKYNNLTKAFPFIFARRANNTEDDLNRIVEEITMFMEL